MHSNELERSLIDTIQGSGLPADLGEAGLDALLDAGIVKDIPVLGSIQKFCNIAETISNRLFAKKMLCFLAGVSRIPKEERQRQTAKLLVSIEERLRVGEFLFVLLDKLDDFGKAELVATVFGAYLREKVTLDEMMSLTRAINLLDMDCIETLQFYYHQRPARAKLVGHWDSFLKMSCSTSEEDCQLQAAALCGLLCMQSVAEMGGDYRRPIVEVGINYKWTKLGLAFGEILSD